MQFSILALTSLVAAASAAYTPTNGTVSAVYPTGTGAAAPSGSSSSSPRPTSSAPFEGAAAGMNVGSGMLGMVVVGGVALML